MAYKQIRINRTVAIDKILLALKEQFQLLNEADIIKLALSQYYFETQKKNNAFENSLANLPVKMANEEEEKIINEAVNDNDEGLELINDELINSAKNA